jgi:very-short-patch-repair endonuclease
MLILIMLVLLIMLIKKHHKEPRFESPIESRLYFALVKRGYKPYTQYRCGYYYIDLALPRYRLAIECDGKAFHSSPKQKARDKKRTSFLYRHGWKHVIRFSGSDINRNPDKCVDRIEKYIKKVG